jgi:rod shape-determining protein MreD
MLALTLLLQLTVLNHIKVFGVGPDLVLIVVIFFGLFFGRSVGMESGLAGGLAKDLFALDFFGVNAFLLALTGFLAGALGTKFSRESRAARLVIVMTLNFVSMGLHFILASAFSRGLDLGFGEYISGSVLPTCVYTALVSVPVFSKMMNMYNVRDSQEYL